jgi:hypothetical protein
MGNYYLDIETTGLDEVENKITTIQYVELERGTGKQLGELTILKEWELGEEEMLRKFIEDSPITNNYSFDFVPVGYNLGSGLDQLTGKTHSGHPVVAWYDVKKYDEIINYIKNETTEFVKWYMWLHKEMPELRTKWENDLQRGI